jgi:hypothetical protein
LLGLFAPASALATAGEDPARLVARLAVGAGRPGRPALTLVVEQGRRIA